MKKLRDVAIGIGAVLILLLAFLHGPAYWSLFIGSLAIFVGSWELVLEATTGKTLSQHFWAYNRQHPQGKWLRLGLLLLLFLALVIHLGWKS